MISRRAFSLIEVLVVVAIIGLLAALSLPAFNSINRGRDVELAGVRLADGLGFARQSALSRNRSTEIRFFRSPVQGGGGGSFQWFQVYELLDDGSARALAKPARVPETTKISDDPSWSSLFQPGNLETLGPTNVPGVGQVSEVRILRFRASGRTSLSNLTSNYFVTALPAVDSVTNNFATLQIDPLNGRLRLFRP